MSSNLNPLDSVGDREEDMAAENDVFQDVSETDDAGNVKERSAGAAVVIPGPSSLLPNLDDIKQSSEQESDASFFPLEAPVYRSVPDLERSLHDDIGRLDLEALERPKLVSMRGGQANDDATTGEVSSESMSQSAAVGSESIAVMLVQPFYTLTPHTHQDLTNDNETHVARTVSRVLTDESVDYKFLPRMCRWDCNLTKGATVVQFQVVVFRRSAGEGAKLVLEMQRFHGQHQAFLVVYGSVIEALEGTPNPHEHRAAQPSVPPAITEGLVLEEEKGVDDCACVRNLRETLKGPCFSHALDSAQAMAKMSEDKKFRDLLKVEGCVPDLVNVVQDGTEFGHVTSCARTFAVTCLANMSEDTSTHDALYDAIVVLVSLIGHGSFDDRSMRREAARCLRNLAKEVAGADEIIRRVGKQRLEEWCVDVFPTIVDPRMQSDVSVIKESLDQRWKLIA